MASPYYPPWALQSRRPTWVPLFVSPSIPPTPLVCNPSPKGHYQDAHDYEVVQAVEAYCHRFPNNIVHAKNEHKTGQFEPVFPPLGNSPLDDIYDFKINSVPGCLALGGYNLREPIRGTKCEQLLFDTWKKCKLEYPSFLLIVADITGLR